MQIKSYVDKCCQQPAVGDPHFYLGNFYTIMAATCLGEVESHPHGNGDLEWELELEPEVVHIRPCTCGSGLPWTSCPGIPDPYGEGHIDPKYCG